MENEDHRTDTLTHGIQYRCQKMGKGKNDTTRGKKQQPKEKSGTQGHGSKTTTTKKRENEGNGNKKINKLVRLFLILFKE